MNTQIDPRELVLEELVDKDTVLVLPSSVEQMSKAFEDGEIKPFSPASRIFSAKNGSRVSESSGLCFLVNPGYEKVFMPDHEWEWKEDVKKWGDIMYASTFKTNGAAVRHFLVSSLGYSPGRDLWGFDFAQYQHYDDGKLIENAVNKVRNSFRIRNEERFGMEQLLNQAYERKGIMVGVGRTIITPYMDKAMGMPDESVASIFIKTRKRGMPIEHITGFVPLGSVDNDLLYKALNQYAAERNLSI